MYPNYYEILGVPADATLETIARAYRERARECHPDRGGSHEAMVRLNEAWAILSDPEQRRLYDRVLGGELEGTAVSAWWGQTEEVRKEAQQYPDDWGAFKKWMDRVVSDVTGGSYGSVEAAWVDRLFFFPANCVRALAPPWYKRWPRVRGSISANISISGGGFVGFFLGAIIRAVPDIWLAPRGPGGEHLSAPNLGVLEDIPIVLLFVYLGAWVGQYAHAAVRRLLLGDRSPADPPNGSLNDAIPPNALFLMVAGGLLGWLVPPLIIETLRDRAAGMDDFWGFWYWWGFGGHAEFGLAQLSIWRDLSVESRRWWIIARHVAIPVRWALVVLGLWLGHLVWLGLAAHRTKFGHAATGSPPNATASGTQQHQSLPRRVIACAKCGKKLRIPVLTKELLITCPSCGNKFTQSSTDP